MGSAYLLTKRCRSNCIAIELLTESNMVSFKFIVLSVAIVAFVEVAHADDPEATKCYAYKTGAFATHGGSNEPGRQENNCGQKSYCYVATKKTPEGQGLNAQKAQFEGDCIQKGDRILSHPGIDVDDLPSCSNQERDNKALVCVCNDNLCNKEQILQEVADGADGSQGLGRTGGSSGSSILGSSLFAFFSSVIIAMYF